jgi:primosomal protein N''
MPTGYTAGILNGTITSFEEFAIKCISAFGASLHMIDDDLTKEYNPKKPSERYERTIRELQNDLIKLEIKTDREILENEREAMLYDIEVYRGRIDEILRNKEKLEKFLVEVEKWEPPTEGHIEYKNFMRDQILSTINHDCDYGYYEEQLRSLERQINNLNANDLRDSERQRIHDDINYYTSRMDEEYKRCYNNNLWVEEVLHSLKK